MNLDAVEIPTAGARERAVEYRRQARRVNDPELAREMKAIADAYMTAVREGQQLIALTSTIARGGMRTCTRVLNRGGDNEYREHYLLPNMAAVRADAPFVYSGGLRQDGMLELVDSLPRREEYRSGRLDLDLRLDLDGHTGGNVKVGRWDPWAWCAMVPLTPPKHWPPRATSLKSRLILFEVEDWTLREIPRPPGDPALLRHLAGDLYVVEATWDLTDLERLVLSGRRPE